MIRFCMAAGHVVSVTGQSTGGHVLAKGWVKVFFCMVVDTIKDVYTLLFAWI